MAPWLLLLEPARNFPGDWSNHLWMIGYYGDYFRAHGSLPVVMNTAPAVGLAQPVFYAWLLYPALGLLAAVTGAALAVRFAVLGMLAVQFFALRSAGEKVFGRPLLACAVAVSVTWATYSLTNLYNRGALAEYFATGFFVTALAFGAGAALADDRSSRWFYAWLAGFFLVLTAGTHAPTAAIAAVFLALLGLGVVAGMGRAALRGFAGRAGMVLAGALVAGAVIVAPWVYANGCFAAQLALIRNGGGFIFLPGNCDTWWGRLVPFPYDAASAADGLDVLGTPYLEAQINVVLLVILFWNLALCRRGGRAQTPAPDSAARSTKLILAVAGGWFVFLAAMSVSPGFARHFQFFAPYVQYAYRFVSHCNAALLVAVLASGVWVARQGGYRRFRSQTNVVAAVCLAVAVLGLGIKLKHAAAVIRPDAGRPGSVLRRQLEVIPDFSLPSSAPELAGANSRVVAAVSFPVGHERADLGELGAVRLEMKQAGWVRTNAVVFPWTGLLIDGKRVPPDQRARTGNFLAVYVPAGSHDVTANWQPDRTWSVLNRLSRAVFALVTLVTLGWASARWWKRRGGAAAT